VVFVPLASQTLFENDLPPPAAPTARHGLDSEPALARPTAAPLSFPRWLVVGLVILKITKAIMQPCASPLTADAAPGPASRRH
jgi:hypothetical protein